MRSERRTENPEDEGSTPSHPTFDITGKQALPLYPYREKLPEQPACGQAATMHMWCEWLALLPSKQAARVQVPSYALCRSSTIGGVAAL